MRRTDATLDATEESRLNEIENGPTDASARSPNDVRDETCAERTPEQSTRESHHGA